MRRTAKEMLSICMCIMQVILGTLGIKGHFSFLDKLPLLDTWMMSEALTVQDNSLVRTI